MNKNQNTKYQKTRNQKGITLVALVITIIVLLILAVVAIRAIQNDSIINYAKNSVDEYERAQANEQSLLQGYIDKIEEKIPGATNEIWTQEGTVVKNTKTGQTLNVGDYVNYTAGVEGYSDTNGWRILGAENGEILLISSDVVGTVELKGRDGYNNYETKLATVYSNYGNGDYASGVRSVDVDDVNRVTGYNPETATDRNTVFGGTLYEYGKTVTYSLTEDGKIACTDGGSFSGTSDYTKFFHPDGRALMSEATWNSLSDEDKAGFTRTEEPIIVTNSLFIYNPANLGLPNGEMVSQGYTSDKVALTMLFGTNYVTDELTNPTGYTGEMPYWLASAWEGGYGGCVDFGVHIVCDALVLGDCGYLWDSAGGEGDGPLGVRPVVSLESDITLTSAGTGSWALPTK